MNATRADLERLKRINSLAMRHANNPRTIARCKNVARKLGESIRQRQRKQTKE